MQLIETTTYGPLELTRPALEHYPGTLLPGAESLATAGAFGSLLLQQYQHSAFALQLTTFSFTEATALTLPLLPGLLTIRVVQKGVLKSAPPAQATELRQGQCRLETGTGAHANWQAQPKTDHQILEIVCREGVLQPLSPYFPFLEALLSGSAAATSFHPSQWLPLPMEDLIRQIFHCRYDQALRDFFLEDTVRDLLLALLAPRLPAPDALTQHSPTEVEKIHAVRALILSNLKHHWTIPELARKVGLNELKLKVGCRQVLGIGPFALLKQARLQHACRLLEETDKPIKEICSEAGYTSLTSFSKAFKDMFGQPPGQLRTKGR